jgi:hypothetical protein
VVIDQNDLTGSPYPNITVEGGAGGASAIQVTGNVLMDTDMYVYSSGPLSDVLVQGNTSNSAPLVGLNVASATSVSDVTITLNDIYTSGGHGITVNASQGPLSNVEITDSLVAGSALAGINLRGEPGAEPNLIGRNLLSSNTQDGIQLATGGGDGLTQATISQNRTYSNAQLGIDLVAPGDSGPGVTLHDTGDGDSGPNDLLNYPLFSAPSGYSFAYGEACANCLIEVFVSDSDASGYGEGQEFLFDLTADGNGEFILPLCGLDLVAGAKVTATATDEQGNTSEFSENYTLLQDSEPCPSPTPSPTPTEAPTPTPTQSAGPTPTQGPTSTVSPTQSAAATPTPTGSGGLVQGDVDCSGGVNPVDTLKLLRFDAGLSVQQGAGCPALGGPAVASAALTWGDVDCNGNVGPVDGLKVLRFDAGLSVQQEVDCPDIGEPVG